MQAIEHVLLVRPHDSPYACSCIHSDYSLYKNLEQHTHKQYIEVLTSGFNSVPKGRWISETSVFGLRAPPKGLHLATDFKFVLALPPKCWPQHVSNELFNTKNTYIACECPLTEVPRVLFCMFHTVEVVH